MKYALNLAEDSRILSATFLKYAGPGAVPEGNLSDYRFVDGVYIYDPIPVPEMPEQPTQLDQIEAQVTYTAMMTDTLLEV